MWSDRALDGEALNLDLATSVHREQSLYRQRIETLAGEVLNDLQCLVGRVSLLVRTIGRKRIEGVGHSNDPRQQGNLITLQPVGISAAVERLVVQLNTGKHVGQLRDRTQNVGALGGMRLHDLELFFRQCSGLLQDVIFNADLAHIVKLSRDAQGLHEMSGQVHFLRNEQGIARDAVGVAARVRVFFVDRTGQHLDGAHEQLFILFGGALQVFHVTLEFV